MKKILVSMYLLVFGLCLVGCESTLRGKGEYKLTVIDDFGYLVAPLDDYYKVGEEVEVHLAFLSGPRVGVNINGEYIGENAETKHVDGHPVITFIMPDKDSILYTTGNGYILKDCGEDNHQWDEGREIEAGNGGYVMKYICELCGKFKEETITIIPPQDCPFEYSITVEGHSKIMLCDCCDAPAIVKPHNDLDKNQTCDECGYVFDTTGINGKYTPELLANLNHNINKIDSLIIEEEILYVILQNNESEKIGKFELNSESSIKLNQIINIDDLSFTNEESKNIVNQLLDKDSFYSMEIASIPEIAPTYILVELNNEFYYIYMESNIAGVSLVTIYHLNK